MMTGEERAHLAGLPDRRTVYRGYSQPGRGNGMSWSLSPDVARRFAFRFTVDTRGRIARREVDKGEVIAYFAGRGEQEARVVIGDPCRPPDPLHGVVCPSERQQSRESL